jgi:hypothetical protein
VTSRRSNDETSARPPCALPPLPRRQEATRRRGHACAPPSATSRGRCGCCRAPPQPRATPTWQIPDPLRTPDPPHILLHRRDQPTRLQHLVGHVQILGPRDPPAPFDLVNKILPVPHRLSELTGHDRRPGKLPGHRPAPLPTGFPAPRRTAPCSGATSGLSKELWGKKPSKPRLSSRRANSLARVHMPNMAGFGTGCLPYAQRSSTAPNMERPPPGVRIPMRGPDHRGSKRLPVGYRKP